MAKKNLNGKVALVTGASAGLGKDFARALLAEGMVVYTAARRVEKMDDLKQQGAIPLKMDITVEAEGDVARFNAMLAKYR